MTISPSPARPWPAATCRTAQIALRAMLRDRPQGAEAHFRLGVVQLQFGDPVAAEKELKLAQAGGWNPRVVMPAAGPRLPGPGPLPGGEGPFRRGAAAGRGRPAAGHQGAGGTGAEADAAGARPPSPRPSGWRRTSPRRRSPPPASRWPATIPPPPSRRSTARCEINPHSVDALLLKGQLQHSRGDYNGGRRHLHRGARRRAGCHQPPPRARQHADRPEPGPEGAGRRRRRAEDRCPQPARPTTS